MLDDDVRDDRGIIVTSRNENENDDDDDNRNGARVPSSSGANGGGDAWYSDFEYREPTCLGTLAPGSCPYASSSGDDHVGWMVPKAIIAGTQKGGTRALLHYLSDHPKSFSWQGTEAKVLNNPTYMRGDDNDEGDDNDDDDDDGSSHRPSEDETDGMDVVDPCHVRRVYHELFVSKQGDRYNATARSQPYLFDKSPSYMLHAEIVPQRLSCVFPDPGELKIVVLLRDPVDRSYSHYHHNDEKYGRPPKESFRSKVEREIALLRTLGIDDIGGDASINDQADFWKRYKATASPKESLIARGLYVLQLRQWFGVLHNAYGTDDLSDVILVLESERLHEHAQETMDDVLDFLEMGPYRYPTLEDHHAHAYDTMDDNTRRLLSDFFRPWNDRLRDFLAPYGVALSWAP